MVLSTDSEFFCGVDLGQTQDYTAIAMVERREQTTDEHDRVTWERVIVTDYLVRGVKRVPLGTPYPDVVLEIARVAAMASPRNVTLVVDATGVGAPVVDMIRQAISGVRVVPVVFTAGSTARNDGGVHKVPKKDLVHGLMVLFQDGRLRIAQDTGAYAILTNELKNLRVKISAEAHVGYEAWREGQHDDLVFALALACWRASTSVKRTLEQTRPILW
ncbi:MAG: hypothetical protein U0Q16_07400 [Bryobacteraceae bacterium]